jgi:hypothetical protein
MRRGVRLPGGLVARFFLGGVTRDVVRGPAEPGRRLSMHAALKCRAGHPCAACAGASPRAYFAAFGPSAG